MACHNLCKINKAPTGIEFLLGLGEKYCVQRTKLDPKLIDNMMERLTKNVRWKYIFRNEPDEDDETTYIPGMHINSEREPGEASKGIEMCLNEFKAELTKARRKYFKKRSLPT